MDKLTHTLRQAIVLDITRLAVEKSIFPEKGLETARAKFEFCLDEQGMAASVTISYRDGQPSITLTR
jgi:hypothetical protein